MNATASIRIALCQVRRGLADPITRTLPLAHHFIELLGRFQPDLIVFPEAFPYTIPVIETEVQADGWPDIARRIGGHVLLGAMIAGEDAPRNAAIIVSPEGAIMRYDKQRPFWLRSGYRENITEGTRSETWIINAGETLVGVVPMICQDAWEAFGEIMADQSEKMPTASLVVILANAAVGYEAQWRARLRSSAVEHQVAVGFCNCACRFERDGIEYGDGGSGLVVPSQNGLSCIEEWIGTGPACLIVDLSWKDGSTIDTVEMSVLAETADVTT